MSLRLLDHLGTTDALAEAFSDASLLASMLQFEVALARVEADAGIIPEPVAAAISRCCVPDVFDSSALARAARTSGTVAIPFVEAIRTRVAEVDPAAATFVHWGATSQDLMDTGLVLCLVRAARILAADHERLLAALRRTAEEHASTVMLARTLLQPAPPTTFGLKAAGWFGAVSRSGARLFSAFEEACLLQFGGASGTLAALGSDGVAVADALARELGLAAADAPWHAHRDRLAALATACGIYTGALGKIARDISLLMQDEVAEAAEPGGTSSTMPHKRNPAGCAIALAAATRVPGLVAAFLAGMPQEHERGLGGWHAEAGSLSALVQSAGSALAAVSDVVEALYVSPQRMQRNIDATGAVIFAERAMMLLARSLGRERAKHLVSRALEAHRAGRNFADALAADPEAAPALIREDLASLKAPESYLGSAERFRRRLLKIEPE